MNKGIKNTDNYFERVKQRANRTNYRYYFFDYLYFKGEVWGKKIGRMSGFILLFWYWWWVVVLPGNFLLINSVPEWSSLHLGYLSALICFSDLIFLLSISNNISSFFFFKYTTLMIFSCAFFSFPLVPGVSISFIQSDILQKYLFAIHFANSIFFSSYIFQILGAKLHHYST